jgi:hypothetical protein
MTTPIKDTHCQGKNCGCKWQCKRFLNYAKSVVKGDAPENFTGSAYPESAHADCIYYVTPYGGVQ